MIVEALVDQLEQRFQHEKRAQVCLWFDEREEFSRLLPALDAYLSSQARPPFVLLPYDTGLRHGQIWMKHQVHRRLASADESERASLRFVLYLPFPEDRLDPADRGAEPALDLLAEYRVTGVRFRIGGKRPTLYGFLKQAGVPLPEHPPDQRRLCDTGRDSLLAKYAATFVGRPAAFWRATLTPEMAQSRLVGDLDQTILEMAADPEGTFAALRAKGLEREFVASVKERYGYDASSRSPAEYVRGLLAMTALTETFLGYQEPPDFPLIERLPPVAARANHLALAHRWLRDAEFRPAWDRRIAEVEETIDLTAWARGRSGRSVAFPRLVRLRWRETWEAFKQAAPKESTTLAFFAARRGGLAEQAEFLRATHQALGEWNLLRDLDDLVAACAFARREIESAASARALVAIYVAHARRIDGAHLAIRRSAEEADLPAVARVADRGYAAYTNALNEALFAWISQAASVDVLGLPGITAYMDQAIWRETGRRAVIIVDAMRYDCAMALGHLLHDLEVEVTPALAEVPTVTAIGMTALLPLSGATLALETTGNRLRPRVNGKDASVRENRLGYLREFGADCRDIVEIEALSEAPVLGELLVVFGHEEVDTIGHGQAETLIRHLSLEVERLARLVRKLHRWGYDLVHVVTDHGFVLLDKEQLPTEVPCDKTWCEAIKERYAIVPATADVPLVSLPFAWDSRVRVAVPPGLAFFKAEKSFSHGGASVQELVIPHLASRRQTTQARRVGIEVLLPTFELQRPAVKIVLRPVSAAAGSGRTLLLDVRRRSGIAASVLEGGPREVRIEPADVERSVTLFFRTAEDFRQGERLELDVRDSETTERFPPGGLTLTVGRDM